MQIHAVILVYIFTAVAGVKDMNAETDTDTLIDSVAHFDACIFKLQL